MDRGEIKIMLRILHILDSLDMGGIEVFVMNLYKNIDHSKIKFDFIIFKDKNYFEQEALQYGSKIFKGTGKNYFEQMNFISQVIRENNYKIIHCHNCSLKGLIKEVFPAKVSGNVVIAHSHNTGTPNDSVFDKIERRFLKRAITNLSDYLFACSYEAGISKFIPSKKKPVKVIKNGINAKEFAFNSKSRVEVRGYFDIDDETLVFGNVGRLERQKNQVFLIHVFYQYLKKNKNARLLLVGDGSDKKELEKLVLQLGIEEYVIFAGNRSDVNKCLMAMDIFAFPSLYEGLGIALIEAQASGLPCFIAENIPKEAEISDLTSRFILKENLWEQAFESATKNIKRENYYLRAIQFGYDIKSVAEELSIFYKNW